MTNVEYFAPLELGEPKEPDVVILQLIDESGGAQPPVVWVDGEYCGSYDWEAPATGQTMGYIDWLEQGDSLASRRIVSFVCKAIGRWQQQGPFEVDRLLSSVQDPLGEIHQL